jgi:hypothetical protein
MNKQVEYNLDDLENQFKTESIEMFCLQSTDQPRVDQTDIFKTEEDFIKFADGAIIEVFEEFLAMMKAPKLEDIDLF